MTHHPIQQGGPLVLHLILSQIQNLSESAVEHLKNKVKCIKISKVQGENTETVCSQIKSACQALQSALR